MNSTDRSNTGIAAWLGGLGSIALLVKASLVSSPLFKVTRRDLLPQLYFIGMQVQSTLTNTGVFPARS